MLALSGTGIGRQVAIGKAVVLDRGDHEIPRYGKKSVICPECSEKAISETEY